MYWRKSRSYPQAYKRGEFLSGGIRKGFILPRRATCPHSQYFWVGVCRPVLKTLTLFQTKKYDFPYPISDPTLKMYTLFQTLWCVIISATLNGYTAYGTSWRPKRCSFFLVRDQCPWQHTLPLKMVSQTKQTEYTPYFRPKWQNLYPISD